MPFLWIFVLWMSGKSDILVLMRSTTGPYRVSWGPLLAEVSEETKHLLGSDGKFRIPVFLILSQPESGYSGPLIPPPQKEDSEALSGLMAQGLTFLHMLHKLDSTYGFSRSDELNAKALAALMHAVLSVVSSKA